jgi:hypothetical protein
MLCKGIIIIMNCHKQMDELNRRIEGKMDVCFVHFAFLFVSN